MAPQPQPKTSARAAQAAAASAASSSPSSSPSSAATSPSPARLRRRRQVQSVVLLLLALGALSVVVRVADLSVYSSRAAASRAAAIASIRGSSRVVDPVRAAAGGARNASAGAGANGPKSPRLQAAELEALAEVVRAAGPAREAHQYDAKTRDLCFRERDVGILDTLRKSAKPFCSAASDAARRSGDAATAVTLYSARGGVRSAVLENLVLDLQDAEIFRPIKSMAEDGGSHDPRFRFNPRLVQCACREMADHFAAMSEPQRAHDQPWSPSIAAVPSDQPTPPSLLCDPASRPAGALDLVSDADTDFQVDMGPSRAGNASAPLEVFEDPVILIARRDDHNPFFQISYALNAWTMVQALGWDLSRTRVLHFDAGYPSPIDALHQRLFSGDRPLVNAHELMGRRLRFKSQVLIAPFELSGIMMQHLDDGEPCFDSELVRKFRDLSMASQGVTPDVVDARGVVKARAFTVTIITRRPYDGRKLQRVWVNEDDVVERMRAEYAGLNAVFQSIDYVQLQLDEQMLTTIDSDLIIGMHGAGMVNVMWTRPETTVVEIFPKERYRWGYRNLCQFLGCDWHQFRGGEDRGDNPVPNTKDKFIPYDEWMAFFHPLFRDAYSVFEDKQRIIRRQQQQPN